MKTHKNNSNRQYSNRPKTMPKYGVYGGKNAQNAIGNLHDFPFFGLLKYFSLPINTRFVALLFMFCISVVFYQCRPQVNEDELSGGAGLTKSSTSGNTISETTKTGADGGSTVQTESSTSGNTISETAKTGADGGSTVQTESSTSDNTTSKTTKTGTDGGATILAPINFKATAGDKKISLNWDKVTGANSYSLYWSTTPGKTADATQIKGITGTDYTHNDRINGTTYYYTLTATASNGIASPRTNEISAIPKLICDYKIPDSGQITKISVYNVDTSGDDPDYIINPKNFKDNGNNTITDINTCLMWEKKPNKTDFVVRTQSEAGEECKKLTLGGYSDWRLPTRKEMIGIVDYNKRNPAINTNFFPNTPVWKADGSATPEFWTSTKFPKESGHYFAVIFDEGYAGAREISYKYHTRCVRSTKLQPATKFTDNGNGTISDSRTGLMWKKDPIKKDWEAAIKYCEDLNFSGHTNWRMPNIVELESITDFTKGSPPIDTNFFPNTSGDYFSSTSFMKILSGKWIIMYDDRLGRLNNKGYLGELYTRCVRSE